MPALPPPGVLHVVATPIGNLEDVTLRALRVLREASLILAEDTRTTRKLLARHEISARLVSCHEHNESSRAHLVAGALERGEDVALVTDAGTPAVSDPGARLVAAVVAAGFRVVPVPGPSAALAALQSSGLSASRFTFFGFPPRRGAARKSFLDDVLAAAGAAIVYEAPHRIARTLADLAARAPERLASLHREMTKVHEEVRRGTLAGLAAELARAPVRGEITLVIEGGAAAPPGVEAEDVDAAIDAARAQVEGGSTRRDAARAVAKQSGLPRARIYRALLPSAAGGEGEEE